MSSAKLIIVLILIPAAGNISNKVTTGPSFTFITLISILKSKNTFSNNVELVFMSLSSSLFFLALPSDSSISRDGDEYIRELIVSCELDLSSTPISLSRDKVLFIIGSFLFLVLSISLVFANKLLKFNLGNFINEKIF